jgi:hypothetical protein
MERTRSTLGLLHSTTASVVLVVLATLYLVAPQPFTDRYFDGIDSVGFLAASLTWLVAVSAFAREIRGKEATILEARPFALATVLYAMLFAVVLAAPHADV